MKISKTTYNKLIDNIGSTIDTGRNNALSLLNQQLLLTYWTIGRHIVEFEQHGKEKAVYGDALLTNISKDLKIRYGKGFSRSNLQLMRLFYVKYPIFQTYGIFRTSGKSEICQTSGKSEKLLSWSHYAELLTVSDDLARSFYEKQALKENWSFREMKRQIDSALFQRLALSTDKKGVLALAEKGQEIASPKDLIKNPYVWEFLDLPKDKLIKERGLEKKLVENLQQFLLELGKGFSFVGKQYKITVDNEHNYIDLVFYHRILKCFVLIDLKTRKVKHQDIGQMNFYLNYFKEEENTEGDNEPIGIIIAADKHEYTVKYATGGLENRIFVSKYQLYLPDQKMLEEKVKEILESD